MAEGLVIITLLSPHSFYSLFRLLRLIIIIIIIIIISEKEVQRIKNCLPSRNLMHRPTKIEISSGFQNN